MEMDKREGGEGGIWDTMRRLVDERKDKDELR